MVLFLLSARSLGLLGYYGYSVILCISGTTLREYELRVSDFCARLLLGFNCSYRDYYPPFLAAAWQTPLAYSRCEPNFDLYPDCRKEEGSEEPCFYVETIDSIEYITFPQGCDGSCTGVYDDCLNGFILWVGPLLITFTMFFLGFFCTFFREGK